MTDRSQVAGAVKAEVYVGRAQAPKAAHGRRWRYDITFNRLADGPYPGVPDRRLHFDHEFGYAYTRWGAWRAIRRSYPRHPVV